jgi:hypothetical protein
LCVLRPLCPAFLRTHDEGDRMPAKPALPLAGLGASAMVPQGPHSVCAEPHFHKPSNRRPEMRV